MIGKQKIIKIMFIISDGYDAAISIHFRVQHFGHALQLLRNDFLEVDKFGSVFSQPMGLP